MRHRKAGRKLGRHSSHRIALARAQATALLREGEIKTTEAKAKELRPFVEKLITKARDKSLHARRIVARDIQDREVLRKLFDEIAPRYESRPGGYTQIFRVGVRRGDAAEMALIRLVQD
jgi:large subunit ribosomal protein L17